MTRTPATISRLLLPTAALLLLFTALAQVSFGAKLAGPYKHNSIAGYYEATHRRRCVERSLEAREANADVVFTGTIRSLEPSGPPPQRRATVEVKRVMKGAHVLGRLPGWWSGPPAAADRERLTVSVEGVGDPAICNGEARIHDTRIFLVSKTSNGELRLNSSLVRISLNNIELAEAAVNESRDLTTSLMTTEHYVMTTTDRHRGGHVAVAATTTAAQSPTTARIQAATDRHQKLQPHKPMHTTTESLRRRETQSMTSSTTAVTMAMHAATSRRAPAAAVTSHDEQDVSTDGDALVTSHDGSTSDDATTHIAVTSHDETQAPEPEELHAVTSHDDEIDVETLSGSEDSFAYAAVTSHDVTPGNDADEMVEPDREMRGGPEEPCERNVCMFGAECYIDGQTGGTMCRCADTCSTDDTVLVPVCGSDSVTYASECHLRHASCSQQIPIAVRAFGSCDKFMMSPAPPKHMHHSKKTTKAPLEDDNSNSLMDPCDGHLCGFGARCVPAADGRSARCQCDLRCDGGAGGGSGGSDESTVVCGDDGLDYSSECELRRRACVEMRNVHKKYDGKCDPCEGVECAVAQVCQLDEARSPVCRCGGTGDDGVCPMNFAPVCASDGSTYSNECLMTVSACRQRRSDVRVLYHDECSAGNNPCSGMTCRGPGQQCQVDVDGVTARCQCIPACPSVMAPVCGSDGKTYDSECHVLRQSCLDKAPININHAGVCNTTSPCLHHACHHGATCIVRKGKPVCICPMCSDDFRPVCSSDGVSYGNECKLKAENCATHKNATVLHEGLCNACVNMKCEFYSNCETDDKGVAKCVCPTGCVKVENKVCGTDSVTYMNECELQIASCRRQQPIMITSRGACDLCVGVKCRYGARCDNGRCVCQRDCPTITGEDSDTSIVCGSDGVTYVSECALRRAACTRGIELSAVHSGMCEDVASGSGALSSICDTAACKMYGGSCQTDKDGTSFCACSFSCDAVRAPVCGSDGRSYGNECQMREEGCKKQTMIRVQPMENCEDMVEELCDGNPVLINPRSGVEYNCNPGRDVCPAGSYCHKLVNVARCCREDQPIKSCLDTSFGCCPDSVTAALGPNNAGCPNVCQCNPLGSYGTTCDPVTTQCTCKPGVGGLHCDRCEPNYWGLPKISEGNSGCLPCNCNSLGSLREDCEQMTGRCVCRPGVTGQKCNICPNGKQLSPTGCTDVMLNDYLVQVRACSDRRCRHGAVCQVTSGIPECVCPATCQENDVNVGSDSTLVCGSDSQTYGSACQLQLFACRLQKDISVAHYGPCMEGSTIRPTTLVPPMVTKTRRLAASTKSRTSKQPTDPTYIAPAYGIIGDFCLNDGDCYVASSHCVSGLCSCRGVLVPSDDNMMCTGEAGSSSEKTVIPSFSGASFMRLRKLNHVNRDVTIDLHFKPRRSDGTLLYTAQSIEGRGDFLALSLKNGFVEFRYDLGSGAALLKSLEKVQLNHVHRVMARRFGKDGILRLDEGMEVSGMSPGMLRSLNLETPLFLGHVPNATAMVLKNVGVATGFVGCIERLEVNSTKTSVTYDLTHLGSVDIEQQSNIRECGKSQCSDMPCMNGGSCLEAKPGDEFTCRCSDGFTGALCENPVYLSTPCDPNPCESGGSCIGLAEGGFICKCPWDRTGDRCEKYDAVSIATVPTITIPQFHGDSYIAMKLSRASSRSLSIEIWFLPFEPNGVLIYACQEGTNKGDFFSVNLVDERLQLRYNLGSGIANITSTDRVRMNEWNKAIVSRMNRLEMLTLNEAMPVKGQSGGILKELNVALRLYVGGFPGGGYHPDSGISSGFYGAVQRFYKDGTLLDNLVHGAVDQHHVTQYVGLPCPPDRNPCRHGARCIPRLNDFDCQCTESYSGRLCQFSSSKNLRSISFSGHTYHRYQNAINNSERSQTTNRFEIRFRAETKNGLLLLQHKSTGVDGDYLAIALNDGHPEVSFNLGKERPNDLLILTSRVNVSEGAWHTLTLSREKRIAQLSVDQEMPSVTGVSSPGATTLDTDGHLWIGGTVSPPRGLPDAYYSGFVGCIEYVRINDEPLDLVEQRNSIDIVSFCN